MHQYHQGLIRNTLIFHSTFSYILACVIITTRGSSAYDLGPDLGALRMITHAGYRAESHMVTTEDGYMIEMHRIPGQAESTPVFLQHGLFANSDTWVLTGKHHSLAYLLSDEGYDVWIGNNRGNTYGKAHMNMSTDDVRFFNFSMHEIGVYDLTAEISYISNFTSKSVILISHSMGSPVALIMTSQRIEMQPHIHLMCHMAPGVFMSHMKEIYIDYVLLPLRNGIKLACSVFGICELPPAQWLVQIFAKHFCNYSKIQRKICKELYMTIAGFDSAQYDEDIIPILFNYVPDTSSSKVLLHYGQWFKSARFQQYDYGEMGNLAIYNRSTPPDYDLTKINIPQMIIYANNDLFVVPEDALRLYDEIPQKAGIYEVDYKKFTHFDFLFGIDARKLVYNHIIKIIKDYQ